MRGEERRQRAMLMILEAWRSGAEGASAAAGQGTGRRGAHGTLAAVDEMYSAIGRPSIPPERLLKASLLMALYTVRSERLSANSLIIIFCPLVPRYGCDRAELRPFELLAQPGAALEHDVARAFFARLVAQPHHAVAFGRTLSRGRRAGRGLGLAQEFQAQGPGTELAARRPRQPDG